MIGSKNWVAFAVVAVVAGTAWALPAQSSGPSFMDSLLALLTFSLELAGGMNMGFLFIILALGRLQWYETLLMADAALLLLVIVQRDRPNPTKLMRTLAATSLAAGGAHAAYWFLDLPQITVPADFLFASAICFAGMNAFQWNRSVLWSYPYYLVAAAIAAVSPIPAAMPALAYAVWHAYRAYAHRLQDSVIDSRQISELHLRAMQTLALAIESRDTPLNGHTRRVSIYAAGLAMELDLPTADREALRVASLLYDIGELAVPEHILTKPGKLTPEEFDKIRIHPQVGAEILERVKFPYPVSPIVLAHHERWNGTGYPKGLIGEEIPRAARILAVADAVDALASPRHYREKFSIEEAVAFVASEAGKTFDPTVVSLLQRNYRQWEHKIDKPASSGHFTGTILSAQKEAQTLLELTTKLGMSLDLPQTYEAIETAIGKLIPCEGLLVWLDRGHGLAVERVKGSLPAQWMELQMPAGSGISGQCAVTQTVIAGSASRDLDPAGVGPTVSSVQHALAAPLSVGDHKGALTLYGNLAPFSAEHSRILRLLAPKLSSALSNALKFRQIQTDAGVDALTGLPNAAALSERMQSLSGECAVVVCDLDGFKQINDRFGHFTGNRVLEAAGESFRAGCRSEDFVARLGGDEFVLLLGGVTARDAAAKLHHFEAMVRDVGARITGTNVLSASFGVAYFPSEGTTPEQLLANADRRMYEKKGERSKALPALSRHLVDDAAGKETTTT